MNYQKFSFDSYKFDPKAKRLELRYGFDDQVKFIETFEFNFELAVYDQDTLDRALFGLFILAGASYYKVAPTAAIEIRQGSLTDQQAAFFAKTYRLGLGEFSYRNQLPLVEPTFPTEDAPMQRTIPIGKDSVGASLVAIGGGKDSIVTIELMREAGIDMSTWMVNHSDQLQPFIAKTGLPHLGVSRTIAPELTRLNQEGAYNGHVPITGILALVGIVSAILSGKQNLVLSLEWSAGEGNAEYQGVNVNHQYSKSFEFEQDLQKYIREWISPQIRVFSLLRPLSELKIAEQVCRRYLDKYWGTFSSCNTNFHFNDHQALGWCGHCPKCAFVFLVFAPFTDKDRLMDLFGGKNLFEDERLRSTYDELLGLSGHKPFECVGEIDECRRAVTLAQATGQWPELAHYDFSGTTFDYNDYHPSSMPQQFEKLVRQLVSSPSSRVASKAATRDVGRETRDGAA